MKRNSIIHIRQSRDTTGGSLEEIERKRAERFPLTMCGKFDVPRDLSVNPINESEKEGVDQQLRAYDSTLCERCQYVEGHTLLRGAVAGLGVAQARDDLRHIFLVGSAAALCGSDSQNRASGPEDGDPFHICLECAVRYRRFAAT
jgi:hypothetical protein